MKNNKSIQRLLLAFALLGMSFLGTGCSDPKPTASADKQMREGLEGRNVKPMSEKTRKAMEEAMAKNQNPNTPKDSPPK